MKIFEFANVDFIFIEPKLVLVIQGDDHNAMKINDLDVDL
jgi:very-short-patch-repair endonuclease